MNRSVVVRLFWREDGRRDEKYDTVVGLARRPLVNSYGINID